MTGPHVTLQASVESGFAGFCRRRTGIENNEAGDGRKRNSDYAKHD
jgi:hypothetical protein